MDPTLGDLLRHSRKVRNWSQLDLAERGGTTQRHLSFIESGRSQPGRALVIRLADALAMTLRERIHTFAQRQRVRGPRQHTGLSTRFSADLNDFRRERTMLHCQPGLYGARGTGCVAAASDIAARAGIDDDGGEAFIRTGRWRSGDCGGQAERGSCCSRASGPAQHKNR
ncbi:helix-turn-helix transcriptional regulator [Nocardia sp. NPDC046763]|uniref:helix-turn-helix domain-containing protein n=1 Tax=Nocardia sp. NPDC046763 TaxID=3155256 RepID=UPI0033DDA061